MRSASIPHGADEAGDLGADPDYVARRLEIADRAAGPGRAPHDIVYRPEEDDVWRLVNEALAPEWSAHADPAVIAARDRVDLPTSRVPQLREVSERLGPLTGFEYRAVPGLVEKAEFFGGLADGVFLSTQYLRHPSSPLYTPEPDVVHELMGHANVLGDPRIAELHRLAGAATRRLELEQSRQFVADVFWFSGEFGVVLDGYGRPRAYGAGLLSSFGEMGWFADHAEVRPLDITAMGTLPYDIDHYQPVLFAAATLDELLDVVGGFFAAVTDDLVASLLPT